MKSSRKKAATGPRRANPHWHAVEVAVPEPSRLALVAGGIDGREPPRANRLIEAIAAACTMAGSSAAECEPTWIVAPSRRVGNEWLETLARTGRPTANLHVTTMSALAYDIVSETLVRESLELAPPRAKLVAVERILLESRQELQSFTTAGSLPRLAERILHSLESLRNAGLEPEHVARGLRKSAKGRDLALLMDRYASKLRQMRLVDRAAEVSLAAAHVRAGNLPPAMRRLLVPDDLDLPRLEADLLAALQTAPAITVCMLETDPPAAAVPAAIPANRLTIFRAAGEANEVRFVLRTCLRLGLKLDEVEIVHTDADTYPSVVREVVASLPRSAGDQATPDRDEIPQVTFAEGLPLVDSRPGRGLSTWLAWRIDGHPQSGLERLLREGLVEPRRLVPDAPQAAALVRELRRVRIGRGLDRSVTLLSTALERVRERPAASFLRGGRDDDDPAEEAGAIGDERLLSRKEGHVRQLAALEAVVMRLAECEGGPEPTAEAVLRGARLFLDTLCTADSEFDGNARRVLLDEIDAMLEWQGAHAGVSARDILDWLERLPADLVVLGSGPRPGCLHVSGLAGGGHSGRPYTFVLGLDENRFPGAAATDPVLTDGDRSLLNAAQPDARLVVGHAAVARTMAAWHRLLGRLRGSVWLGYSCRDTTEDAEIFPSPALVAVHAAATSDPLATGDSLRRSLPPPESFVPADPELALDETQWRLALLGPEASATQVEAALAAHRDHLAHGAAAAAARRSDDFTPHDGHVPAAGPLLDPRGDDGRVASPHSLETLGGCPRRFFFRYGLSVEPLEVFDEDTDQWLNPRDAGSLLHTVLERFMRRIVERRELPGVDRHLDELLALLDEELAESRRKHPPLTEPAFAARRDELRGAMSTFLHDEERSCRESGLRPLAIEAAIGMESAAEGTPFDCPEPVAVALAPGETIRLRGRIDRIDVRDEDGAAAYSLWDYKSGSGYGFPATAAADPFDKGRKLQHGLYVVMLRARLADPGCTAARGEVERFGYFFPTRAGKGRRLTWTSDQLAHCTDLVRQLAEIARQGAFLATSDPDDCSRCDFSAVCGDPARVTRTAARMLAASAPLTRLFADLRGQRRPARAAERRRPNPRPLAATPHPAVPEIPPDEAVRRRIREDLGTTLLVEAAAGTGKTTCMVDRMLALVRTGAARPEGIVAVTFTKKAAGELRRRFRERLQQAAVTASGDAERARLTAALERIDSMVIGTIHSFAGRLLRERPIEAGVDPGFRELDEAADRLLRRQAWREFVTAAATDHAVLVARLDALGLRLGDLGRLFIERFATYGDVEAWPAVETPAPDAAALLRELEEFVGRIEAEAFPPAADRGTDELMNALEQFARMFRRGDQGSIAAVMDLVQELDRSPKVTQAGWPGAGTTDAEVKASRKAAATAWQAAWEEIRERVARPALWQWRAHRYPTVVAALQAALRAYDRLRAARGVLSFQDLLCKAARLLADDADVRRGFRARYTHMLVDEFQDTDPVQAQMLLLLAATDPEERDWRRCRPVDGSLFVVGDPKQSLYRFRRADIVTYSTVRSIIAQTGDVLALTTNFRSRGDIVAWTNDIFAREFPPEATLESPSFTASTSGRREAAPGDARTEACLTGIRTLRFTCSGHAGDAWAEGEAREIAAFIRGAIDAGMMLPRTLDEGADGMRRCGPGDFLIVTRERRHLGIYAAALHAAGLPVDVTGTLGADQAEPLHDLRTCLAAVADSDDPVATLALLRGGIFGFSDADLHAYASAGGRFDGGIVVPDSLDPPLRERFAAAREACRRWRRWMRHLPVAAAVERLIDDAGLMLIAAAAEGEAGPRGRAVAGLLQHYVERLRSERLDVVAVHDCLDLLDDMIDSATRAEFDPLSIDVPSADRVRIMNLHKAKGLESPVVFLADYQARTAGERPEEGPFLHIDRSRDRTEGWLAATTPVGRSQRIIAAPPGWPAFCERERAFELAEQIRLDYVAATRAGSCMVVSLFERHEAATKTRPESYSAEGAWARFAPFLADAPDLPDPVVAERAATPEAAQTGGDVRWERLVPRLDRCRQPTFARISPRELLTEPAEGIRFTGDGLGEPWGRAIHRLLELAAHDPSLDLAAAAAVVLSNEELSPAHLARAVATVDAVMQSDVWRRAQASDARRAEVPFSVQIRGDDLPERVRRLVGRDGPPLPTVVRGVIDLVFREPDGSRWTVVDWKTDAVAAASTPLLESHYRPQVELYADCWGLLAYKDSSGDKR